MSLWGCLSLCVWGRGSGCCRQGRSLSLRPRAGVSKRQPEAWSPGPGSTWVYESVMKTSQQEGGVLSTQIPELQKSTVHIQEPERVERIISALCDGGVSKLQVITDFDMTLTRFAKNSKKRITCYSIIQDSTLISDECKIKMNELLNFYYPIEIDHSRSIEEKFPLMIEWWTKVHELLVEQKIEKSKLAKTVKESGAELRDGFGIFFGELHKHGVPVLIFSAGVGDVLEEIIRQFDVYHQNITVVSNFMDFDENGILKGFKGEIIHVYNKREGALRNTKHLQQLRSHSNVILLGDSLGDPNMADGVQNQENILKIGFLNDKVDQLLNKYLALYDIVLVNDETLDVANGILKHVLNPNHLLNCCQDS
ncbi:kelch-like protein 11 isoform X4 [Chiloscyllium punctatum]